MPKKNFKQIPKFKNYHEERNFWQTHNPLDYVDYSHEREEIYLKNLERKTTVRFSLDDLKQLRKISTKKGIGVTTFIRQFVRAYLAKLPHSV